MQEKNDPSDRNEDDRGVHLMTGEYSLCGSAWDGEDGVEHCMRPTRRRVVTCPACVAIVLQCKAARVNKAAADIFDRD